MTKKGIKKALAIVLVLMCTCLFVACSTTEASIEELEMHETDDVEMHVGDLPYKSWVNVEPGQFSEDDLEFVLTNDEYATVKTGTKTSGALWFEVTAVTPGKTGVYAQTKDGSVKSEIIQITIYE